MAFSQIKNSKNIIKTEAIDIKVSVDSIDELNHVVSENDFDDLFDIESNNQNISFELKCSKEDKSKSIAFKISGKIDEKQVFKKQIREIKENCKNFYLSK